MPALSPDARCGMMLPMAKRILILGAQGMLGTQLARIYRQAIAWDKGDVDVLDAKAFEAQLRAVAAGLDAVVNCVAFNDVDGAEDRPEAALRAERELSRAAGRAVPQVRVAAGALQH